jgi:hypothetical protein
MKVAEPHIPLGSEGMFGSRPMTEHSPASPLTLAERIEVIEQAYELMLAYAAQGRQGDRDDSSSIRRFLQRADAALDGLAACLRESVATRAEVYADFIAVLEQDARSTRAAFRLVLARQAMSSQLIENLNASIHIRALLTDIFLIDATLNARDG